MVVVLSVGVSISSNKQRHCFLLHANFLAGDYTHIIIIIIIIMSLFHKINTHILCYKN